MESYNKMMARHQQESNNFPIHFAFGDSQIKSKFAELGLDPENDIDKILAIPGTGGFILKKDEPAYLAMCERHKSEFLNAIAADKKGTGFIYQMFRRELEQHEFAYTENPEDTLNALGYTEEQIKASKALKRGFEKAKNNVLNRGKCEG